MPGGPDGGGAGTLRLRTYLTFSAILSGITFGILLYRRAGSGPISLLGGPWVGWIGGRREL
jgi:F0F1-type ATP synthase assembly protein I